MMISYDDRDIELNIPIRLACLIAEIASGVEDAQPEEIDHTYAERVYEFIREQIDRD